MAGALIAVPGVEAVVLGGSGAQRAHHPGSDVDLGVYYDLVVEVDRLGMDTGGFSAAADKALRCPGADFETLGQVIHRTATIVDATRRALGDS